MGSSPVTATIASPAPTERLCAVILRFFRDVSPLPPGAGVLVAFSGGPDSLALLAGLATVRSILSLHLTAAHLDHGLDPDSARRAERAAALAGELGIPCEIERRPVDAERRAGESVEAAARRVRYAFLEERRQRSGAALIATAHHRDDQAETVALRLLAGTGVAGLSAIRPRHGAVVRPLLALGRREILASLPPTGLEPTLDPTNEDGSNRRGRIRRYLLPGLDPDPETLAVKLADLAAAAAGAQRSIERRLEEALRPEIGPSSIAVDRQSYDRLPSALREPALDLLRRLASIPYPASRRARAELARQLERRARAVCHCGDGWQWVVGPDRLELRRPPRPTPPFTYTVRVPGAVAIPEIGLRLQLRPTPVDDWMYAGDPRRAGLTLALREGDTITVRNRRPGDRLHPLGGPGERRLKDVLIDRHVPAEGRDSIPLLIVEGRIVWVPGITIDERCRLRGERTAWLAELEAE